VLTLIKLYKLSEIVKVDDLVPEVVRDTNEKFGGVLATNILSASCFGRFCYLLENF
jgi:hypothetical protein